MVPALPQQYALSASVCGFLCASSLSSRLRLLHRSPSHKPSSRDRLRKGILPSELVYASALLEFAQPWLGLWHLPTMDQYLDGSAQDGNLTGSGVCARE